MNSLSSHVLDTTSGKPAVGLKIELTLPSGLSIDAIADNNGRCNYWQRAETKAGEYHIPLLPSPYGLSSYRGS